MIGRLRGVLAEKNAPWVLLDVQGVGYELQVPMSTYYNLPELQAPCTLLTHLAVREDAHALYGFETQKERTLFRHLIKVSGIGAKIALAVLSSISAEEFLAAVQSQEPGRLVKIPGIGKKTAERLLLELKEKIIELGGDPSISPAELSHLPKSIEEVVQALCALGYKEKEAANACKSLPEGTSVTEGIKLALKNLSKA